MPDIRRIKLKVVGENSLHCSGCESTVEFTLRRLPGVLQVKADHQAQIIDVEAGSDEPDLEQIEASLDWIGYQVKMA
jgi:copper chaperone